MLSSLTHGIKKDSPQYMWKFDTSTRLWPFMFVGATRTKDDIYSDNINEINYSIVPGIGNRSGKRWPVVGPAVPKQTTDIVVRVYPKLLGYLKGVADTVK